MMAIISRFSPQSILDQDQAQDIYYKVLEIKSEIEESTVEKAKHSMNKSDEWEKTVLMNEAYENFANKVYREFNSSPHISYVDILIGSLKTDFYSFKGLRGRLNKIAAT